MSTPLMFGAAFLQKKLTCYLYPHVISFNSSTCRWEVETRWWKLVPFYFVTIVVVILLGVNLCILQVLKYIFYPRCINGFVVTIMITLVCLSFFCWAYSIPCMFYGNDIVTYMNSLADFEEVVREYDREKLKVTTLLESNFKILKLSRLQEHKVYRPEITWEYLFRILLKEIQSFLWRQPYDGFGLIENAGVFYVLTIGWFVVPVAMYYRLEPFFYAFNDLGIFESWSTILIRAVLCYLCVLETARTFMLFCPVVQHSCIYLKCVEVINNLQLSRFSILMYKRVLILHHWGDWMVKYVFAIYLGAGFYMCIVLNIFTLVGWEIYPIYLYIIIVPLTGVVYNLMLTIPPTWSKTHENSIKMIKHDWPKRVGLGECREYRLKQSKRILKSLQPVTFRSGNVATLNNETKRNYFGHILYYTMTLLLVFESSVKNLKNNNSNHKFTM